MMVESFEGSMLGNSYGAVLSFIAILPFLATRGGGHVVSIWVC